MIDYDSKKEYIISQLGDDYIEADGGKELRYQCPFCKEAGKHYDDYKLYVSVDKGVYWCHRCESKGRIIFDKDLTNGSNTDVYKLFDKYLNPEKEDNSEDSDYYIIPKYRPIPNTLSYEYLMKRNISDEDIDYYNIRVSGLKDDKRFFGRVIIPNRVINKYWTDMYNARTYIDDPIRYKNPRSSKRNSIVFNLFRIHENCNRIIINEGAINSIIAGKDSVASFGKYISDEQLNMIISKKPSKIYVSLDTDAREKAEKLCDKLVSLSNSKIYLVKLPEKWDDKEQKMKGLDASDLGRDLYQEYINRAVEYKNRSIYFLENIFSKLGSSATV